MPRFEGVLLATVIAKEPVLRETGRWPRQRKPPLDWTLSGLVDIAFDAGWIPSSFRGQQLTLEDGDLGNAVEWLAWLRNLVHPGAFVRELAPEVEISDAAFANGFGVIEEVFNRLAEVLNDGMPEESGELPKAARGDPGLAESESRLPGRPRGGSSQHDNQLL